MDLFAERNIAEANLNHLMSLLPSDKSIRKLFKGHCFALLSKIYDLNLIKLKFGLEAAALWFLYSDIDRVRKGQIKKAARRMKNTEPIGMQGIPWKKTKQKIMAETEMRIKAYYETDPNQNPVLNESNWKKANEKGNNILKKIKNKKKKKRKIGFYRRQEDNGPVEPAFIESVEIFDDEHFEINAEIAKVKKYKKPKSASEKRKTKNGENKTKLTFDEVKNAEKKNLVITYTNREGSKVKVVRIKD